MKLLVDMPLSLEIAGWLRSLGHDAVHVRELSDARGTDAELFKVAAGESRVVITAGLDFGKLLDVWSGTGQKLILLRGGDYSDAESMEAVSCGLEAIDKEKFAPSIVVVGRGTRRKGEGAE